jgi:hypothetical protein
VTHTERLREVIERHNSWIAPAALKATYILLRDPERSAKRLREAFASRVSRSCARSVCACPCAK